MAHDRIVIEQQTRLAHVTLNEYYAKKCLREPGRYLCDVLGIFQSKDDDWAGPVAVCVLDDGTVIEISPERLQFNYYREGMLKGLAEQEKERGHEL